MNLADTAATRVTFLHTDLDLATTFVNIAKTELKLGDRERSHALIQKAWVAIETVRRLAAAPPPMARDEANRIAIRCSELESMIQSIGGARQPS